MVKKLVTKLWNAFWFIEMHCTDINISQKPQNLGMVNEWILTQATHCFTQYKKSFNTYEFSTALDSVERFFWHDFCDNYLELIKDQLFKPERYNTTTVTATRWSLYQVGLRILQLYAPYIPYITDFLYNALYKKHYVVTSLHQTKHVAIQHNYTFNESVQGLTTILFIVAQVRKLKSEQSLSLKTTITQLTIIITDTVTHKTLKQHEQLLAGILSIESFTYEHGTSTTFIEQRNNKQWYATVTI